ncbi:peroxin 24 [Pyricularia oryzae Y34]|uniref:Peroxin 24 n=2 Tax=Pyricularia oryzae TaxID=318829 RepID=A0AA97PIP0_PYRO3|nr:peroxin 24 [Pyricularia oryzae Y34]
MIHVSTLVNVFIKGQVYDLAWLGFCTKCARLYGVRKIIVSEVQASTLFVDCDKIHFESWVDRVFTFQTTNLGWLVRITSRNKQLSEMDELSSHVLTQTNPSTPATSAADYRDDEVLEGGDGSPNKDKKRRSLRNFLKGGADMQDKLLEKLLQQIIPSDLDSAGGGLSFTGDGSPYSRPAFSLPTMSYNFRRFNTRIGVVFKGQIKLERLVTWRHPTRTLSFLAVYTLVCLDPYLLSVLPMVLLLTAVLVPSFIARHPDPPSAGSAPGLASGGGVSGTGANAASVHADDAARTRSYSSKQHTTYNPRGPPVAPARTVKPVKELSRDFFRNLGHLQNTMADFVTAHDAIVETMVPATNFSDEARSSALFVALFFASAVMSIAAHLLPWRLLLLVGGWAALISGHPAVHRRAAAYAARGRPKTEMTRAKTLLERFVDADIILDQAPETREVEIFELQRRNSGDADEWEPWKFSPTPYDPMSPSRLGGGNPPQGARYFEDVLPPEGWEWSEKKWALDLFSREWVEEGIITGVEVETEGERWVYDMYNENEGVTGVVEQPISSSDMARKGKGHTRTMTPSTVSWEEGFEGVGKRGEWRRRRWTRLVRRKKFAGTA